jgi:hypothetical protein
MSSTVRFKKWQAENVRDNMALIWGVRARIKREGTTRYWYVVHPHTGEAIRCRADLDLGIELVNAQYYYEAA